MARSETDPTSGFSHVLEVENKSGRSANGAWRRAGGDHDGEHHEGLVASWIEITRLATLALSFSCPRLSKPALAGRKRLPESFGFPGLLFQYKVAT